MTSYTGHWTGMVKQKFHLLAHFQAAHTHSIPMCRATHPLSPLQSGTADYSKVLVTIRAQTVLKRVQVHLCSQNGCNRETLQEPLHQGY